MIEHGAENEGSEYPGMLYDAYKGSRGFKIGICLEDFSELGSILHFREIVSVAECIRNKLHCGGLKWNSSLISFQYSSIEKIIDSEVTNSILPMQTVNSVAESSDGGNIENCAAMSMNISPKFLKITHLLSWSSICTLLIDDLLRNAR